MLLARIRDIIGGKVLFHSFDVRLSVSVSEIELSENFGLAITLVAKCYNKGTASIYSLNVAGAKTE